MAQWASLNKTLVQKKILVVVGMSYQFLIDIQRFSIAKLAKSFCDDDLKKNNVKSYVSL